MATDKGTRLIRDDGSEVGIVGVVVVGANGATGGGFTPAQTSPTTATFVPGDTTGTGGSNGTVTQVVAANPTRSYLAVTNNGSADVELWFGAKPADSNVGLTPKRGLVIPATAGYVWDSKTPNSIVYATTSAAGGLSVIEG